MSSPTPQRTGHSAAPLTSSHRIRSIALATLLSLTTLAAVAQGSLGWALFYGGYTLVNLASAWLI